MKINDEGTTALKKDVLADINQHGQYAILSSTANQDLSVLLVTKDETNQISTELYQLETLAGTPLKKDRDEKIAKKFYKEQLSSVTKMIEGAGIKTLILDYNLSFWVYKKKENIATFLVRESKVETVWAGVKTRLATEETLAKLLPQKLDLHSTPLTRSGIIALSLLKSYAPEQLKTVAIFNENLSKNTKEIFDREIIKQRKNNPKSTVPLPSLVEPEVVFDVEQDKENASELEALEWALRYAQVIRNPRYEETFKKLVERAKKPVIRKQEAKKRIIKPKR